MKNVAKVKKVLGHRDLLSQKLDCGHRPNFGYRENKIDGTKIVSNQVNNFSKQF